MLKKVGEGLREGLTFVKILHYPISAQKAKTWPLPLPKVALSQNCKTAFSKTRGGKITQGRNNNLVFAGHMDHR